MKIGVRYDRAKSLVLIESAENCDSDSWPLVPDLEFRHFQSAPDREIGAIGAAILFARYCGTVAEFPGARISIDAAKAIRMILPEIEAIHPIDGAKRDISEGVSTLIVGSADRLLGGGPVVGAVGRSPRVITWSGDFVAPSERDSARYVGGDVFTNARLVAGATAVSIALGLLWGGKDVRDIYVPEPPEQERDTFDRIAAGLEFVGVKLYALERQPADRRRHQPRPAWRHANSAPAA